MFKFIFAFILLLSVQSLWAQVNGSSRYQHSYYKPSTGTYVQGHHKTNTNKTNHDNYSTQGNSNSYTGSKGHRAKDHSNQAHNYGQGKIIQQGSRGGQYYYNSNGKKVYVPKR
jgi:hypothetical protein